MEQVEELLAETLARTIHKYKHKSKCMETMETGDTVRDTNHIGSQGCRGPFKMEKEK